MVQLADLHLEFFIYKLLLYPLALKALIANYFASTVVIQCLLAVVFMPSIFVYDCVFLLSLCVSGGCVWEGVFWGPCPDVFAIMHRCLPET